MDIKLKELKDIKSENCVTIILNTHRTRPDSDKDAITLKNLVKEAEDRLAADSSSKNTDILVSKLKEVAASINHSHNLESLILFVNEEIAQFTRLPIPVKNRVVIDHSFATRDLVRAMHLETNYFVLVLSQQKVRLIEAVSDKAVAEEETIFPIINEDNLSNIKADPSNATRRSNLLSEFFNQVDKAVNEVRRNKKLPVLICTEESNYYEYMKVASDKQSILDTYLSGNRTDDTASTIVNKAWEIMKIQVKAKNNARKAELKKAVSQNKFLSDTNEIWNAIQQGRIQTLFIEQGLFQPAVIKDNVITYVTNGLQTDATVIDDMYDELISANLNYGGDVVFLPKGELTKFNGFGAITRY